MIYWKHAEKVARSFQGNIFSSASLDGAREVHKKERVFQRVELMAKRTMEGITRENKKRTRRMIHLHSSLQLDFRIVMEQ